MTFKDFLRKIVSNISNRRKMLPIEANNYRQHILDTYFSTRIGIAIISILFPLILLVGGHIFLAGDTELKTQGYILGLRTLGSISAYYHSPMRNVFVGILFAIGAFLYLYKGYSTVEDFVLDGAGILAVGVALFPTSCPTELECDTFTEPVLHTVSAISFFILIAGICLAEAWGKLPGGTKSPFFRIIYVVLGAGMIVLPLLAWILYRDTGILIFKLELAGVWVFSAYWIVKSIEIYLSEREDKEKFKFK